MASKEEKKNAKKDERTEEEKAHDREGERLVKLAKKRGLVRATKPLAYDVEQIPKHLLGLNNDITKKATARKNKYLISFPGILRFKAQGTVGEMRALDTPNPIFYMEFPIGRAKLFGSVVYPKNKYITLQPSRGKGATRCEDVFDAMIVFPEIWWIGTKDENPNEKKLDWPPDMEVPADVLDATVSREGKTSQDSKSKDSAQPSSKSEPSDDVKKRTSSRPQRQRTIQSYTIKSESEDSDDDESDESEKEDAKPLAPIFTKMRATKAEPVVIDDDDDDDDDDNDDEEIAVVAPKAKPKPKRAAAKRKTPVIDTSDDELDNCDDSDSELDEPLVKPKKKSTPTPKKKARASDDATDTSSKQSKRKSTPSKRKAPKAESDDESDSLPKKPNNPTKKRKSVKVESSDDDCEDDAFVIDDDELENLPASSRPRRQSSTKKSAYVEPDSDEDEDEEEGESDSS